MSILPGSLVRCRCPLLSTNIALNTHQLCICNNFYVKCEYSLWLGSCCTFSAGRLLHSNQPPMKLWVKESFKFMYARVLYVCCCVALYKQEDEIIMLFPAIVEQDLLWTYATAQQAWVYGCQLAVRFWSPWQAQARTQGGFITVDLKMKKLRIFGINQICLGTGENVKNLREHIQTPTSIVTAPLPKVPLCNQRLGPLH